MTFETSFASKGDDTRHIGIAGVAASNMGRNIVSARSLRAAGSLIAAAVLTACSGGSQVDRSPGVDPTPPAAVVCDGQCTTADSFLTVDDVKKVIAQAVAEAQAQQVQATIAVSDRVGNILAVYRMGDPATRRVIITQDPDGIGDPSVLTGLNGIELPTPALAGVNLDQLAAISKAVTASYLSSEGNAFSTRTASYIVQPNFPPRFENQMGGPLSGVQISQLGCSDTIQRFVPGGPANVGPHPAPLGLSADPGGLPLYKAGAAVGGVGIMIGENYALDLNVTDRDKDTDEIVAVAATFGFAAPVEIRAERAAVVGGVALRFSDATESDLATMPLNAAAFDSILPSVGTLIPVPSYTDATIRAGTAYLTPASGFVRAPAGMFPSQFVADTNAARLVNPDGTDRFPFRDGGDEARLGGAPALRATEVQTILSEALGVAAQARAGIRREGAQAVRVNVHVVNSLGEVLGAVQSADAPIFGSQVSLQKARAAVLMSSPDAMTYIASLPSAGYLTTTGTPNANRRVNLGDYVSGFRDFVSTPDALTGQLAFSSRGFGNFARKKFPDGIGTSQLNGPFAKNDNEWSVFSTGIQVDLVNNGILNHVLVAIGALPPAAELQQGCGNVGLAADLSGFTLPPTGDVRVGGGIQIFAGAVPIYNGRTLVGAIGISGDGIDQDDMVAFLGLHRAGVVLNNGIGNAPTDIRIDTFAPAGSLIQGSPARYVQCPQKPFLKTDEQRVCEGK
jgi:uncharacterized protein GlcG (DUF336 family)